MITLPLNKYYVSTIITTTSQSYYIKHTLHITYLLNHYDFIGFNDFIGLKNTSVAIGPRGPMLSFECNSPKRT